MTRAPSPAAVSLVVLNLRMGGQLSSMVALAEHLATRGIDARVLLPDGVTTAKSSLTHFQERPFTARLRAMLALLAGLRTASGVVHLVLPSPAFASLAALVPVPKRRIVLQYEGAPTRLDDEHFAALREDPALVLPRLILNNGAWAHAAKPLGVTHLATTPYLASWLRARGFTRVEEIANVASLSAADEGSLPAAFTDDAVHVAYIGHAFPVKGVADLVAAFARAWPRRNELALHLALSQDGDRAAIDAQVRALPGDVAARVHFHGIVPVKTVLARIDALVLPYRTIATTTVYPSLLLEADLAGCPVVTTKLPELEGAFDTASPALTLVPPRDVDALADALVALPRRGKSATVLKLPPADARVDALAAVYARLAAASA